MSTVRVGKNVNITELASQNITPTQINIMLALMSRGGDLTISNLISTVRTSNRGYRFVDDSAFYRAVTALARKQLVTYG